MWWESCRKRCRWQQTCDVFWYSFVLQWYYISDKGPAESVITERLSMRMTIMQCSQLRLYVNMYVCTHRTGAVFTQPWMDQEGTGAVFMRLWMDRDGTGAVSMWPWMDRGENFWKAPLEPSLVSRLSPRNEATWSLLNYQHYLLLLVTKSCQHSWVSKITMALSPLPGMLLLH